MQVYSKQLMERLAKPALKWVCGKCGAKIIYSVPSTQPDYVCLCGSQAWHSAVRRVFCRDYF